MVAIDIIVLGIIAVAGVIGLFSGVIRTAYRVLSFICSLLIALKFANPVAKVLQQAEFYRTLLDRIYKTTQGKILSAGLSLVDGINDLLDQIPLPENIKPYLAEKAAEKASAEIAPVTDSTAYAVSTGITDFLTVIIAAILLFIVVRILFSFIFLVIKKVADAPVIKQVDRSIGLLLGCVAGLLIIFSVFTAFTMFASGEKAESLVAMINDSTLASYLYHNNPINHLLANKITD